ncbi:hypothetical protein Droror1_Dr00006207 [Drosera rotundifolia]
MALPSLKRIRRAHERSTKNPKHNQKPIAACQILEVPANFICPISLELMTDPVTLSSGISYDRISIETWLESGKLTCPVANQTLKSPFSTPNHTLRKMIQDWSAANKAFGMERITTPKSPLSIDQIVEQLEHGEEKGKEDAVVQLKRVLALGDDEQRRIVLKQIQEFQAVLLDLITNQRSSKTVINSCLYVIYSLICDNEKRATDFVKHGLVSSLLHIMIDNSKDKPIIERALCIMDTILDFQEGRDSALNNTLTIPVLVKKILRVSDPATEFSVSTISKLLKKDDKAVAIEAAETGLFQKLLLVLQIRCDDQTKEKATEVLKVLNGLRKEGMMLECVDSGDFKNLKRTF